MTYSDPYRATSVKSTHAALTVRVHHILTLFDKKYVLQATRFRSKDLMWWTCLSHDLTSLKYLNHWLEQANHCVFLPFLRNQQITKEAFQFLESNRKLVKGHLMNVLSYLCKDVWSFQCFLFQAHYTSPSKFLSHNNSYQIPAHTPVLHNEELTGIYKLGKKCSFIYTIYRPICKSSWKQFCHELLSECLTL